MELFPGFSDAALTTLRQYDWPGNIRELKNVVERSVYRAADAGEPVEVIALDPFASEFRPGAGPRGPAGPGGLKQQGPAAPAAFPIDFRQEVQDFEIELIRQALAASRYNQKKAAAALGVTYHQLRGYMKKYELFGED